MKHKNILGLAILALIIVIAGGIILATYLAAPFFNGERALRDVYKQIEFGPRVPESTAHAQAVAWMQSELENSGWSVEIQEATEMGHPLRNVIAKSGKTGPWIILCAHYDSRQYADHDPDVDLQSQAVPGANDGASGVAVLLEIARVLPKDLNLRIWLVLFDGEDQGKLPGWDWILGSTAFVKKLEGKPDAVVLLDMIGDADLQIYLERGSTQSLALEVWDSAKSAGYGNNFIAEPGPALLDDHIPFLQAGIPAIDIIDFSYPYWHTTQDTPDKVSAHSLQAVGDTLLNWLTYRNTH